MQPEEAQVMVAAYVVAALMHREAKGETDMRRLVADGDVNRADRRNFLRPCVKTPCRDVPNLQIQDLRGLGIHFRPPGLHCALPPHSLKLCKRGAPVIDRSLARVCHVDSYTGWRVPWRLQPR